MKIVKAQLDIPKYIHVNKLDSSRDSLYEDVKSKSGKKIVSQAKDLDSDMVKRLQDENDVYEIWVKRSYPKWVFSNQARKRNLNTLEMKEVDVEYGKAIKQLAEIQNVLDLKSFLEDLIEHSSSDRTQTKIENFLMKVEELIPDVKSFRDKLQSVSDDQKRKNILELMNKPPDEISPIDFPNVVKKFSRKYMDYLCRLEELRFQAAEFVFNMDKTCLDEAIEERKKAKS